MPDKTHELIEQMIEQRLKDMVEELKNLNIILEGYKSAAENEVKLSDKLMATLRQTQQALGVPKYLSGRWPVRDGDSYGIVAAQPQVSVRAEPRIDGNDPTGNLRSSDERGD